MAEHAPSQAPPAVLGTGAAGGKVIILGEHAVVYGHPALAASLDRGVVVRVEEDARGPRFEAPHWNVSLPLEAAADAQPLSQALERVRLAVAPNLTRVVLRVEDRLPLGSGLGSSAALTVAVARALAQARQAPLAPDELMRVVQNAEQVFHGTPSGVDQACVVTGGIIRFVRREGAPHLVEEIAAPHPVLAVVALLRPHVGTKEAVEGLRARRLTHPRTINALMGELGALADDGVAALRKGDLSGLGEHMNLAHGILHALGVSSPDLDQLVAWGRTYGALGAKLTGAGVGGAVVMLTDGDPGRMEQLVVKLRGHGAQAFGVTLGGRPRQGGVS